MDAVSVYTGIWRNYNSGLSPETPLNLTLTIPKIWGAFFIAFLALFWVVHGLDTTKASLDVALQSRRRPLEVGPLVLTAASYMLVAYFAALSSSRVQLEGDEVLATGDTCGFVGLDVSSTSAEPETGSLSVVEQMDLQAAMSVWGRWIGFRCLEYVNNCYTANGPINSGMCKVYTTPSISMSVDTEALCPFSPDICAQAASVEVDSGYVDSNLHLGINTRKEDRLRVRKVTNCAPILAEKFASPWTASPPSDSQRGDLTGNTYKYYYLGQSKGALGEANYTWMASNHTMWDLDGARPAYTLGVASFAGYEGNFNESTFIPIPELWIDDTDIHVLHLFNDARYASPVEDPWFRARNNTDQTGARRPNNPLHFIADSAAASLACTEQYEFCNTTTCSGLAGLYANLTTPYRGLELTSTQQAIFNLVSTAAHSTTMYMGVTFLGSRGLLANDLLWFGDGRKISSPLPPTQWEAEVANFGNIMLATLQRLVVDFAAPPDFSVPTSRGTVSSRGFIREPGTEGERALCSRVRLRDPRYDNFSVLGVGFILVCGLVVVLFDTFGLPGAVFWLVGKLRRRGVRGSGEEEDKKGENENVNVNAHSWKEWHDGNLFMLQRSAFEGKGVGGWQTEKNRIPWTSTRAMSFRGSGSGNNSGGVVRHKTTGC